jgi:hypothetical protein
MLGCKRRGIYCVRAVVDSYRWVDRCCWDGSLAPIPMAEFYPANRHIAMLHTISLDTDATR